MKSAIHQECYAQFWYPFPFHQCGKCSEWALLTPAAPIVIIYDILWVFFQAFLEGIQNWISFIYS